MAGSVLVASRLERGSAISFANEAMYGKAGEAEVANVVYFAWQSRHSVALLGIARLYLA